MSHTILVIDDEDSFRIITEEALRREGYLVFTAQNGAAGAKLWREQPIDVVLLDRNLPDVDGIDLLSTLVEEAQVSGADTHFIVVTAYAEVENAVEALRRGAEDYLTKPVQLQDLLLKIRKALEARRLRQRVRALRRETGQQPDDALFETHSTAMRAVLERADRVAQSPSTSVLLQGESGTGKEVLARFIHDHTPGRRDEAFVEINCAAITEGLLESELFGHERGAFTDAKGGKRGLFEVASGGTLLLDEIGELSHSLQGKLLRVLETMRFRRVGGVRELKADVRVIAATNRELAEEVRAGRFRLDLFHRLDVIQLTVPPLRDRREDILPLARFLLVRISQRLARPVPLLAPAAERVLEKYAYPGNIRELRNVLERALIFEPGAVLGESALIVGTPRAPTVENAFFSVRLSEDGQPPTLAGLEKLYIECLLAFAGGNRTQVGRLLDVSYPTVAKKISDYGIVLASKEPPTGER